MRFHSTPLEGAILIEGEPHEDERGSFERLWCETTFRDHGIDMKPVQSSLSKNTIEGTVRGLHFQWPPSSEAKLVTCVRGEVFDAIVDLRPESATFTRSWSVQLGGESHRALYIPPGFAHGFQTLEANSTVNYMMSEAYAADLAAGVRYNDPTFGIEWPLPVTLIAERDRDYADFDQETFLAALQQAREAQ